MRSRTAPYLFLAPPFVLFAIFLVYPVGRSLWLSFTKTAGPAHQAWLGGGNYAFLVGDGNFWRAVGNTALFTVLAVTLTLAAALGLALALDHPRVRAKAWLRFALFCPHLVGSVFLAVILAKLLHENGPLNELLAQGAAALRGLGIGGGYARIGFTADATWAFPVLVLAALWLSVGYSMIYVLAALQAVDRQLYEAAAIDGASPWRRFRDITLPGIRGTLTFLALMGTIGALQLFELPYVLFNGPAAERTQTIVGYLYQQGFETGNLSYAAAIGWTLTVIIAAIALVQIRLTRQRMPGAR